MIRIYSLLFSAFFLSSCAGDYFRPPNLSAEKRIIVQERYADYLGRFETGDARAICDAAELISYPVEGQAFGKKSERKKLFIDHIKKGMALENVLNVDVSSRTCAFTLVDELTAHHRPNFIRRSDDMVDCIYKLEARDGHNRPEHFDTCAAELNYKP